MSLSDRYKTIASDRPEPYGFPPTAKGTTSSRRMIVSITIVTRYSGDADAILKLAKVNGPLFLKYGATSARLLRQTTGTHVGQHVTAITYDSLAAYEAAQAKLTKDANYNKTAAMLRQVTVTEERNILADVPF